MSLSHIAQLINRLADLSLTYWNWGKEKLGGRYCGWIAICPLALILSCWEVWKVEFIGLEMAIKVR